MISFDFDTSTSKLNSNLDRLAPIAALRDASLDAKQLAGSKINEL